MQSERECVYMNTVSWILLAVIIICVILAVLYMIDHGIDTCSGNCKSCGSSCRFAKDMKKAQRKIRFERKMRALRLRITGR